MDNILFFLAGFISIVLCLLYIQLSKLDRNIDSSLTKNREDSLNISLKINELVSTNISNMTSRVDQLKDDVINRLFAVQKDNATQLEKIREVVDEKLHNTLEQKLGLSFKLVSERLDLVTKGLGEMQTLAQGVGDLKKVLTNVKLRGTWGEVQLRAILSQMLSTEQFLENVQIRPDSNERVEFAIKIPTNNDELLLLPIDSKFPIEDYQKIMDDEDKTAIKQLAAKVKLDAKIISEKYIHPPKTTDFGIMFLPTEGLYAEVLRTPGLCEYIQAHYRVITAGPLTLTAILNSIQLGFKTLTIQKRSMEVLNIFRDVRAEFIKFGSLLDKTHKKILEAGNVIEIASKKSKSIEKKLDSVEQNKKIEEDTTDDENIGIIDI